MPEWKPRNTLRARTLRRQATPAERELWRHLSRGQLDAKFSRQMPVGPFFADFLYRELKLVIELDGESHDLAPDADASRDLAPDADASRDRWMARAGYTVLRIANAEVHDNPEGVATEIRDEIERYCAASGVRWINLVLRL
ncbi:hypothetical protein A6F68_00690 [Tsuneonella dongtanensis]|uniref:DUF559 domain-containing protein n=1 Tax=Tsuneonella dongtanensis TaxID=692370 RepID=A0A1B2AAN1_9SPHN|nr:DUF559 domain-containing protein [Tsuneonella dongtanensis]ANY19219.1 hypothetical protein A6F68_00690 [Tsuneonella dongtanensis]